MNALRFAWSYVLWHYTTALGDLFGICRNMLWGIGHIFSVPVLLRTLFVPWHRLSEHTGGFFDNPATFLGDALVNLMMRIVGFVVRIALLSLALICSGATIVVTLAVAAFWLALPVTLFYLFYGALNYLFVW